MKYQWTNSEFKIQNSNGNHVSYIPLVNDTVMSCITVDGHGDNKISQNHFLLEPVSIEDLHSSTMTRNFWCQIGEKYWSIF